MFVFDLSAGQILQIDRIACTHTHSHRSRSQSRSQWQSQSWYAMIFFLFFSFHKWIRWFVLLFWLRPQEIIHFAWNVHIFSSNCPLRWKSTKWFTFQRYSNSTQLFSYFFSFVLCFHIFFNFIISFRWKLEGKEGK